MNKQLNINQSVFYTGKINTQNIFEKLIWLFTVYLLFSFLLLTQYTWGRYSFFITVVLVFFLSALSHDGRIKIKFGAYQGFLLVFSLFVLSSSLWAINSSDAIEKFGTLFSILICFSLVYFHYIQKNDVSSLLSAVMWAGYAVALYTILFYGLDNIILATEEYRLSNKFANVNTIGFACTTSCLIQFAEFLYSKKNRFSVLFAIPTVVVIAATQSRSPIILLLVGIVCLVGFKNMGNHNHIKNFLKTVFFLAVTFAAIYYLSKLKIFGGLNDRLEDLIKNIWSTGKGDSSSEIRLEMIRIGIEIWRAHPIFGVGIGNSHIVLAQYIRDAYLHNNFAELLSGGGTIGFLLYYSVYIYLFYNLWKYRGVDKKMFSICFAWLIAMLVSEYGGVFYYGKAQWFYFMIQFINIECMKRKVRVLYAENQKNRQSGFEISG